MDRIKYLNKLINRKVFTNQKNRIWSMCQATLQMLILTVAEAEKANMTEEQFYINFEDTLNQLSVKDHTKNDIEEIEQSIHKFMADSE